MNFLAVDFGTTSTKSALVDLDTGTFFHLQRHTALPTPSPVPGHHEVSLHAIRQRFARICNDAWAAAPYEGIVLCSEMHGFAILDPASGSPLSEYISWLDARALEPIDGTSTLEAVLEHLGADRGASRFREISGMRPRAGFPLLNLIHCARTLDLPEEVTVVSLPGLLTASGGEPPPEHPTILAGMAFYDVVANTHAQPLLQMVGDLGGIRARLGPPAADTTVAGRWKSPDGQSVPIYAGVGDHQCSVLGAGVAGPEIASINLGTGSQVGLVGGPLNPTVEHRPFFDGRHLSAMTHIPSGRALNEFVGFLQLAASFGRPAEDSDGDPKAPDVWQALGQLTPADVAASRLDMDLAVFDGARGWSDGGGISGIVEGRLTPEHYLASLLRAFAGQYGQVLDQLDPERTVSRVALSGGIARNLPHLAQIIADNSARQVDGAVALDESLLGLRALALRCSGQAETVAAAQARFGRKCNVE